MPLDRTLAIFWFWLIAGRKFPAATVRIVANGDAHAGLDQAPALGARDFHQTKRKKLAAPNTTQ